MNEQRKHIPDEHVAHPGNGIPPQHMPKIGRFANWHSTREKKGVLFSSRYLHRFNCTFVKPLGWGGE